jgi:hypothetical protein
LPEDAPLPYPPPVRTSTAVAFVLSLALAGAAHAAELPPPGGVADIEGVRMLGLSAGIAAATSNDGIYLNPGAIAARRRYSVEGMVLVDRRGAVTADRFLGGSVVDSESAPVSAGVSYLRAQEGVYQGNVAHLALAGPLAEKFYLGVTGKYLGLSGPRMTKAGTMDAGVFWEVADLVAVGVTGYNLVPVSNTDVAPMGAGAGLAVGSDRSLQVTADWRADFDRLGKTTNRYAVGAEALLGNLVAARIGWMDDEVLRTKWWSAGAGLVAQNGIALDIGYRQSIDAPSARTFAASLKYFVKM